MADGMKKEWAEIDSGWDTSRKPVVVTLVAPRNCGKTVFLASLRHLTHRASYVVDGVGYRLRGFTAADTNETMREQAMRHVDEVYQNMMLANPSESSVGWYTYRVAIEQMGGSRLTRRDVFILDGMGGHLFPGLGRDIPGEPLKGVQPTVRERLEQLDLDEPTNVLMVFINEPRRLGGDWRMHPHVPAALANYIEGTRFSRVILYVACADVLFPRFGNLGRQLAKYNRDVVSAQALWNYVEHFSGSPHCDFTLDLIRYLSQREIVRDSGRGDETLGIFWGSAFGVDRRSGQPNISPEPGPSILNDPDEWIPSQVLEPLLWSADFIGGTR